MAQTSKWLKQRKTRTGIIITAGNMLILSKLKKLQYLPIERTNETLIIPMA